MRDSGEGGPLSTLSPTRGFLPGLVAVASDSQCLPEPLDNYRFME